LADRASRRPSSPPPARFEVWASPGGRVWGGDDQEEAVLEGLRARDRMPGATIEVFERRGEHFYRVLVGHAPPQTA
jgi:hypothetical protein